MSQLSRCKLTRVRKTVEETVWKDELTTICRSEDLTVPPLVGCCRWNQLLLSLSQVTGTAPSNYHPILLTSIFSKVLERIIRKQVSSFIDKKSCLSSTQHGFRSGRSCLSASFSVFDGIMHMLEDGGSVDMVYLDFSEAFDKVHHEHSSS